ncbi:MAG: ATP-binding protein [Fibrobacter sp.]|jgi:anti-sigma regulatory factor (Ser/Thr protein kinase)|nr:ATP-binding protein [Fibrobacter sp.]MBR2898189.1 ATP-binding protein [Fibrobacter sp.]
MAAKEITVDAALEKGEELTAFVESMLEPYDPSPKATVQVDVAIDEVFSNIVMYSGAKTVTVVANLDEPTSVFSLTFIDKGNPYNPLEKEDPDVSLPVEEREIGGLGIFLVKKTMDDVHYERKADQNYFTIYKKIK